MRRLSIVIAAFAIGFAVMPMATAADNMLEAEIEGFGFPNYDEGDVAARCPEGFGWIYNTLGGGEMATAEYTGGFEAIGQHCSRWISHPPTDPDQFYRGRVEAGMLTLYTPEGDLVVHYRGMFKFHGDLSLEPPEFAARLSLVYRIDGDSSSGVFAGASGVGLMKGVDKLEAGVPSFLNMMHGPIHFED